MSVDGGAVFILDEKTGKQRPSTARDLADAARLADALPQISFLWPCVAAQETDPAIQALHEFYILLKNSAKHIQAMTVVDPVCARGTVEMAACAVGGMENLKKSPIISNFQCSISPLSYDGKALEAALVFAQAKIPTGFMTMQASGSTAPVTLAGNLVLGCAEILAGVCFLELLVPGAPTFFGSSATVTDMKTGNVACGGPEDALLQAGSAELARHLGLPSSIGTFATGAMTGDFRAGAENSLSAAVSMMARADMMSGAGLIRAAATFSPVQVVLDCEVYEMVKGLAQVCPVDPETLALDVIAAVGPQGHYLLEDHTFNHMRDLWQPSVFTRISAEDWQAAGSPGPVEKAREKVDAILESHNAPELEEDEAIREILKAYEAKTRQDAGT